MPKPKSPNYSLKSSPSARLIPAPVLPYKPPRLCRYNPPIALIGCGGISRSHMAAYRDMKLNVVALCDKDPAKAQAHRDNFFPSAKVFDSAAALLRDDNIEVVDIATHPQDRQYLIPQALEAGKHVLSQKPFVLDLDKGQRCADLADRKKVKLAVNQNGRWSPYVSYIRHAIAKGLLGETFAAHLACHWDHQWVRNTHFNRLHHVILYDFAIHWFDMIRCYLPGRQPKRVLATLTLAANQTARPPMLGQVLIEFDGAQASLVFDAVTTFSQCETAYVAGSKGTIQARGSVCAANDVTLTTAKGIAKPQLEGKWFNDGFAGSMGELLCAIEAKRAPSNNARDNLQSLALCFAAVVSAQTGRPQTPGKVRKAPAKTCQVAPP